MIRHIFALIVLLVLGGCLVSQQEFYELQRQTAQLQREFKTNIESVSSEAGQLKSSTGRLDELHDKLRKSFADANARIDELDRSLAKLKGEHENMERDAQKSVASINQLDGMQNQALNVLKAEVAKLTAETALLRQQQAALFSNLSSVIAGQKNQKPPVAEKKALSEQDRQEMYDRALALHSAREFQKSIDAFDAFLIAFPADALVPNALYWIGESYYSQKKYRDALGYFHRIITDYPNAGKVAAALLKESLALRELGMKAEAKAAQEELLVRFPYSDEAKQIQKK